ncbi:OmpA-like domain-containing protein [Desulfonema limicola]|uniref:OmpA-like domain-containing protein n=1 Tax=Desulfonema limicola TaxID=45656 RepID=A0A975B8Y9_9BACT|nr:OmpA family protein [Desulfonema limicola]QTA81078.1 OmpA-like domain-containing protein [Desulfonema limicola]
MSINWSLNKEADNDWVSISDLMSVLMIIFLFIAVSYMHNIQQSQQRIKKVAVAYQELQTNLYEDLMNEFQDDLSQWQASIEKDTLSIRFAEPEVLFSVNSSNISKKFYKILDDFFPRYIRIISSEEYRNNIEEIRIEGHTSTEWNHDSDEVDAYFNNMRLSQDRTRTVLQYCLGLISDAENQIWARKYITANGLSSSHIIKNSDGVEDKEKSRRVEFRTKTNAEKKVVEIIENMENI